MSAYPPEGTVRVLMTPEAMESMYLRDHLGRRLTFDWGEPNPDGYYEPTISVSLDDPAAQDMADGAALRRLREALPDKAWTKVRHYPYENLHGHPFIVTVEDFGFGPFVGVGDTIAEAADDARRKTEPDLMCGHPVGTFGHIDGCPDDVEATRA